VSGPVVLQGVLLVGASACLNYAFLLHRPWLALVAGGAFALAIGVRVPA
jgi:hypothetical protein